MCFPTRKSQDRINNNLNGKSMSHLIAAEEQMSFSRKVCDALFDYQTLKIVNIGDKKIGLLHRIIQLLILGYILG